MPRAIEPRPTRWALAALLDRSPAALSRCGRALSLASVHHRAERLEYPLPHRPRLPLRSLVRVLLELLGTRLGARRTLASGACVCVPPRIDIASR